MHELLARDLEHLPDLLGLTTDQAVRFLADLAERPVAHRTAPPGEGQGLPQAGLGLEKALAELARRWEPGLSASAGPRYLGFVTGGATPAGIAGDWLTAAYDQNVSSAGDSSASDLEKETVRYLRELVGLSEDHGGAFVSGATMSNTVGLAIAREWVGEQRGVQVSAAGLAALGRVTVLSGTPHSSVGKALSVLGLGRTALRTVATLPGREAVDVEALAAALAELDGAPAIVVANAGTVNTVDFDDLRAVAALRDRFPFWLHVDAAFGAFAALSPAHAHLTDGLDLADSVCVDLHKWLNVPYDAAVQFTRRRDLQTAVFHNESPYLGAPSPADPDFLHLTPENSRRLRALPAWLTLAAYGAAGHGEIVVRNAECAAALADTIAAGSAFRLLAPARLNVVCFTLADDPTPERLAALRAAVTDSGEAFLTPTVYAGVPALRAAFSNWRTTRADVTRVAMALATAAAGLD
ncbi:pyridoxal phosphate-dependent decarboxylase family protein [Actinacidiphila acididurans]|uniref:Aspartate aminotransferase family protein n=1 Tax=Actinacidiphila acididurans TaxID=2784346 RepID=A0ABS2TQ00_9ACTN|nr:pyridoxal-dependent decarboxylase [Actinacidiphila acididurans]MBM9505405.1 aspartate aminotransferase family protein [Actinacidiphila acididurans]